ncbi:MAG: response regulator [Lachnospiraceae bacterium]|nr:response regulator [Lachnospiraceae bacterium]
MNDIRNERLVIFISTLAGIACILQNIFGGWELWVLPIVAITMIALWWFHFTERPDQSIRINICFVFSAFLVFYHGIHKTSLYEVSVATALFLATFMILDNVYRLNVIFAEYIIVMIIQFVFLIRDQEVLDAFTKMRIAFHIGAVISMYIFSRITVNRNIEEKQRVQEWLGAVQENDLALEDFLSNISHELRTPINVINGMTKLMQNDNDCSELASIYEAGIRLAHQVEDVQDYTELKQDDMLLEEENYMCASLINDVISSYMADQKKNDLELIVDISPSLPAMLKGDVKKLHKIFRHLLENAVKFTKRGGIFIKVFSISQEYGINLIIEVSDTGMGMTRADISGVSKGMYQADKSRNRSTGGIGTGLPIVYGFTHKMGGFVNINSSKGSGTTVRICIPQQVVDPSPFLSLKDGCGENVVFYNKVEKYRVPEVRDYYIEMAADLADGLNNKIYFARDIRKLEHLLSETGATHIFTEEEEYASDRDALDALSKRGYKIIVSSKNGNGAISSSNILMIPKPVYAFPIVRILNGDEAFETDIDERKGKIRFTGTRALVVDDEPMNLVVASGILREYKMLVETAESGKEAVEKYKKGNYDVIFLDHMMPEMDGVETLKQILGIADTGVRKPVMIALTANTLSGAKQMFINEGFDGFIAKPINIREFERVMRNTLSEELIRFEGGNK